MPISSFAQVAIPCIDEPSLSPEEFEPKGEHLDVCAQIVVRYLYLARIGRPDSLWSANMFGKVSHEVVQSL